jgi:glutathione peroxidase
MHRRVRSCVLVVPALVAGVALLGGWSGQQGETGNRAPASRSGPTGSERSGKEGPYVLDFKVKAIDGSDVDLSRYKGKVVLIVNVASRCGYTPQYEGLQELYDQNKDRGLVVLGFPANNFKEQEPGTNEEIAEFCRTKYGVEFPIFEKVSVAGKDQHPLYARLASQPAPIGGDPKWNFTKFLLDRKGNVVDRFEPKVKPDDPALVRRIDELLGAEKPAGTGPNPSGS